MTSARIEEEIVSLERWLTEPRHAKGHNFYRARIEKLQALLKERAENGTYHDNTGRW